MRLLEAANDLLKNREELGMTAYYWLTLHDPQWELRRRMHRRAHTLKVLPNGAPIRDHYLPHIPISAEVYGRTWKDLKALAKATGLTNAQIWEKVVLPLIEKHIKEIKK